VPGDRIHPRPQLARGDWLDLSGPWGFAFDDEDVGVDAGWFQGSDCFDRTITVPFPPESQLSGIADPGHHPVVWYHRSITLDSAGESGRVLLHFGAVDHSATVWLDGELVGRHEGGHTPFCCDITAAVGRHEGDTHAVVVRAEDRPTDLSQPRGKQDWRPEPHGIWYHRTTGIWQPVWIEIVPKDHVADLHWTVDVPGARVGLEALLSRTPDRPLTLRVVLRLGGELVAEHTARVTDSQVRIDIALPPLRNRREAAQVMWSPRSPTLVEAEVSLDGADGAPDRVGSYFGVRTVGVADGRFELNGRALYVRSVLAQGYWPESHLAAPSGDALRREVELIKDLGFNAVRVHQKVEDPRFLYWCDRLGLMVWGEMANAFSFGAQAVQRLTREWLEVVDRDRSHPCIVTWVPMNESWGVDDMATEPAQRAFATALFHLTKAVDPTRPVLSNDGWEHAESDIWTIHDYSARGSRLRSRYGTREQVESMLREGRPSRRRVVLDGAVERGQPIMLTEFGGVRFDPQGQAEEGWGYSTVQTADDFGARLGELFNAVLDSPTLVGFCYTQLTDTAQERNGLLTEAREPKIPIERIRAIVRRRAVSMTHDSPRDVDVAQRT